MSSARRQLAVTVPAWLLAAVSCALSAQPSQAQVSAPAPAPARSAHAEIEALIQAVGRSDCRFQRNGRWHAPAQAQSHLQRKYDVARRRGMSGSAEDFIERAGSRSSLSGRAYRIACPGQAEVDASVWFSRELARLRTHAPSR